jgi:glutaredoxin
MRWLAFWRQRAPLAHWDVVMYTRSGCHLCEVAWEQLRRDARRYGFALRQVDVDGDPELVREHGHQAPVVEINGRVRFRGAINPVLFRRLVAAEKGA